MGLNLAVMGPPGAGKGTQADRIAATHGLPKISTGDILRAAIKAQSPLGLAAKAMMEAGGLVDDRIVIGIVSERLQEPDAQAGFLLDGFPRTVEQARELDRIMAEHCEGPLLVVNVEVPDEELVRRLLSRRICEQCGTNVDPEDAGTACRRCGGVPVQRKDDVEDVVRERLAVYERQTRPLIEFYQARPTFRAVNGAQVPDLVTADLTAMVASAREQTT